MTSWIVLQLADSAFPIGGFAHSGGLEAMVQRGAVGSIEALCGELVHQTAHGALPIVGAAFDDPGRFAALDRHTRATLWSHVAARASRAQGRALLTAARAFEGTLSSSSSSRASEGGATSQNDSSLEGTVSSSSSSGNAIADIRARLGELDGHLAPAWGLVTRTLGVTRDDALAGFLHVTLRGQLGAAIRLGVIGPNEAQAIHHRLHPVLDAALAAGRTLGLADVAQTAPLIELFQATHDRLYSRLFQS